MMQYMQPAPIDQFDNITAMACVESATSQSINTGDTILTHDISVARVTPTDNVTGVILEPGEYPAQTIWVINESDTYTLAFAKASGSYVADGGAGTPIPVSVARKFVWNSVMVLWYRAA